MNPAAPVAQSGLDLIQKELDEHLVKAESKTVVDGILAETKVDFGRATYRADGKDLTRDPKAVEEGLRAFCTEPDGRLDEEMLLGISKVAYQSSSNAAFVALLDPGKPETSQIEGSPSFVRGAHSVEYNLSRNDDGEVLLDVKFSGPVDQLTLLGTDGIGVAEPMEPERSRLDFAMELKARREHLRTDRPGRPGRILPCFRPHPYGPMTPCPSNRPSSSRGPPARHRLVRAIGTDWLTSPSCAPSAGGSRARCRAGDGRRPMNQSGSLLRGSRIVIYTGSTDVWRSWM